MIEYRKRPGSRDTVVMLECPVCDTDLRDRKPARHFWVDHVPEDFPFWVNQEVAPLAD